MRPANPKKKTKWNNVGIPPEVDRDLTRVCSFYGWSKRVAVERLVKDKLASMQSGFTQNPVAPPS